VGYDISLGLTSKETIESFFKCVSAQQDVAYSDPGKQEFLNGLVEDARTRVSEEEGFNVSMGMVLAQFLGSLDRSWYLRGTGYSDLFTDQTVAADLSARGLSASDYLASWKQFLPEHYGSLATDTYTQNYSLGAIVSTDKISRFLLDYEQVQSFRTAINRYANHNILVILNACLTARENSRLLFEASDLVVPAPGGGSISECYIYDTSACDPGGGVMYMLIGQGQLAQARGDMEKTKEFQEKFLQYLEHYIEQLNTKFDYTFPAPQDLMSN
jgi:hypothetical protein